MFEMGFFSPGVSKNKFLGIWHTCTPDVVVWVANRNDPIRDPEGLHLTILGHGALAIANARGIIWSTSSFGLVSFPILQLLDTGNLVLVEKTKESFIQLWQSFDFPTDTLLPGMKLVYNPDVGKEKNLTSWRSSDDPSPGDFCLRLTNKGLADSVIFKGSQIVHRTGAWNGHYFSGTPPFPNPIYKPEIVFEEGKLISFSIPYETTNPQRVVLDKSGSSSHFLLNSGKNKWNPTYANPLDSCDEYGKCGPFGVCTFGVTIKCQCLMGYTPKFPEDWDLQDWSGGCTRASPLDCQIEDHDFFEVTGIKYPDTLQVRLNKSMSLKECKTACLRDCSCVAYTNPYITEGSTGCLIWFGELIDTRYLSTPNNKQKMYIRLRKSELDSLTAIQKEAKEKSWSIMILVIGIVSGVTVSSFVNIGIQYMSRQSRKEKTVEDVELPLYKFSTIMTATNNFSTDNIIGEGGFGPVYKGMLSAEVEVAIKRLSRNSEQGFAEFKNEVTLIAKLQHRNLVRLLGCCIEKDEKILIYELLPNKSLNTFVFDRNRRTHLTWPKRFNIIMGIARGLLYLHHDSRLKIIHRDLKTSNILLDGNLNPKISDFGMARPFEEDEATARTRKVVGSYGYMSPEYAVAGKFSVKSDIFSLGVILLETLSGKKNRGYANCHQHYGLLARAWLLWKENKTLELLDECLTDTFIESQVKRCIQIGLLCVQRYAEDRPDMISVYSMLATDEGLLPEPKEPGFFIDAGSDVVRSYTSTSGECENGTMSMTDLEAR
ncbi:G-type lectin S-receptor-like serine/threonine-protein kinase At4g27290 isoform X2 [Andrographis paniculata]|nr:G-type lectin S-receptor-like serine/threonine-protein kinase At4g27290 isoform X2 [Andrographis paniculata]